MSLSNHVERSKGFQPRDTRHQLGKVPGLSCMEFPLVKKEVGAGILHREGTSNSLPLEGGSDDIPPGGLPTQVTVEGDLMLGAAGLHGTAALPAQVHPLPECAPSAQADAAAVRLGPATPRHRPSAPPHPRASPARSHVELYLFRREPQRSVGFVPGAQRIRTTPQLFDPACLRRPHRRRR